MDRQFLVWACAIVVMLPAKLPAAGPMEKLIRVVLERATGKFGREIALEGTDVLGKRLAKASRLYGDDALRIFENTGPKGLRALEMAGPEAAKLAPILAKCGTEAAWIVGRPGRLAMVLRYGDDAATALVRHREIAENAIRTGGRPAAQALAKLNSRSGRRFAMIFDADQPLARREAKPLLAVIAAHGEPAMDFVWKHKGALAISTCLVAFLNDPAPFISGVRDLTQVAGQTAMQPVTEGVREASRQVNWTMIFSIALTLFAGLVALRWRRRKQIPSLVEQLDSQSLPNR